MWVCLCRRTQASMEPVLHIRLRRSRSLDGASRSRLTENRE
jgi:hypothetical protein